MTPDSMNHVFEAMAHPVRRKILDLVKDRPGASLKDVCDFFEISRIAVMKHLRVLVRAELVVSLKEGRTRQLYFNAVPIQMVYERWTTDYSALWASGLTRIKYRIESMREASEAKRPAERTSESSVPIKRKRNA